MTTVTIVVGNPKAHSRTRQVAEAVAARVVEPDQDDIRVIELSEHVSQLFTWPSPVMDELMRTVAESEILIIATPTYKASYTGLLKAFLDRYPNRGLAGTRVHLVMTGADSKHALAPEVHLRPLLVELGASVPTAALYFLVSQTDRLDEVVTEWAERELPSRA